MLKTGKQMKLELFKNYKITTGTIDNRNIFIISITTNSFS